VASPFVDHRHRRLRSDSFRLQCQHQVLVAVFVQVQRNFGALRADAAQRDTIHAAALFDDFEGFFGQRDVKRCGAAGIPPLARGAVGVTGCKANLAAKLKERHGLILLSRLPSRHCSATPAASTAGACRMMRRRRRS
jgi:hypothetical protein